MLPNRVIALFYTGIAVGDIGSGLLSQLLRSRRKAVFAFLFFSIVTNLVLVFAMNGASTVALYVLVIFLGLGMGYWVLFVTIAAE